MLEVIFSKGNPRIYSNQNLSLLEVGEEKLTLYHPDYIKEIRYEAIKKMRLKKGIMLELDNEIIQFLFLMSH